MSVAGINLEEAVAKLDNSLNRQDFVLPMRFAFDCAGVHYEAALNEVKDKTRLSLTVKVCTLPYSAEDIARRQALSELLLCGPPSRACSIRRETNNVISVSMATYIEPPLDFANILGASIQLLLLYQPYFVLLQNPPISYH